MGESEWIGPQARFGAASLILNDLLHDLKQPLNFIRVAAQDVRLDVTKNRLQTATLAEDMRAVEKAVDQVVRGIDSLRQFARTTVAVGKTPTLTLAEACRLAVEQLSVDATGVSVTETIAEGAGGVPVPASVGHAVWELLDNGVRATRKGDGASAGLELRVDRRDQHVVVSVRDRGPGVADAERARIFEPLFAGFEGTSGLGLPIARVLVQRCGGTLELARTGPEGSIFEISLPLSPTGQSAG